MGGLLHRARRQRVRSVRAGRGPPRRDLTRADTSPYRRGHGRDAAGTDERRESFDSRKNAKNPETVRGLGDGAYFYVKGTAEVGVPTVEPERQLALRGLEELDRIPRRVLG